MTVIAPFGGWRSPITPDLVAGAGVALWTCQPAGDGVVWMEGRPLEQGRNVLVHRDHSGRTNDLTPEGFSARTRVHEYGGIPFAIHGDRLFFSNDADQRLYAQSLDGGDPEPITHEPTSPMSIRYGDLEISGDGARIFCVRERHEQDGVWNELVALPADGSAPPEVVVSGNDFYANPR